MINFPEFLYLKTLIEQKIINALNTQKQNNKAATLPKFEQWTITVPKKIKAAALTQSEKTLVLLALAPHIDGHFLDHVINNQLTAIGDFPLLGGIRGKHFRGFLPTGQTAMFLLAENDFDSKKEVFQIFDSSHFFSKNHILWLEEAPEGEPKLSGRIMINPDIVEECLLGKVSPPRFSLKFPAQLVTTEMEWNDLVINETTEEQIQDLHIWIKHNDTLFDDWEMKRKLKPGYRTLFHGPPGTGKTLTASLLGKYTNKDVYKIDLSMVVSKFIGETEKNLANLLNKCEKSNAILFFDEADALFGKRTNVRDAHDKYANQEVSYLLQRIESYNGLVILASNFKTNIDDAFIRRFQSIIHFPLPKADERGLLWEKAFSKKIKLENNINFSELGQKFELSGAEIMNVVQYACLWTLGNNKKVVTNNCILNGIQREFQKSGRIMR